MGQQHPQHLGACETCKLSGAISYSEPQNALGMGPALSVSTSPLGDSPACWSLRASHVNFACVWINLMWVMKQEMLQFPDSVSHFTVSLALVYFIIIFKSWLSRESVPDDTSHLQISLTSSDWQPCMPLSIIITNVTLLPPRTPPPPDNPGILCVSRSLITSAKVLFPCKVTYSRFSGFRAWTSVVKHYIAYQRLT